MRFRDHSQMVKAEIQLAPLIDVVFILLMFFIVTWNFARSEAELDISVPKAETANQTQPAPGEIVVNVMKNGEIRVNRTTLTKEQLMDKLQRISAVYPDQPIILRGDMETQFAYIMTVLDTCQKAGIWNVAFAAEKTFPAAPAPGKSAMKGAHKAGLILLGVVGAVGLGVLLSFGVVTAKVAWREAEVDCSLSHPSLPAASAASPGEIVINVKTGGEIQVGTTLLSAEQLHDRLKRISAVYPEQAVIIRGESKAEFSEIMAVLDGCQKAGIWNVAFASAKAVSAMP